MSRIWETLVYDECTENEKLASLISVLNVYSSLLGILDDEFKDIMHSLACNYMGPSPEIESEFLLNFYARKRREH